MPLLPDNWTMVPVTGQFFNLDNSPVAGTISFASAYPVTANGKVIVPKTITVKLDAMGRIPAGFALPSTNDPDITPVGWTYTVTESFTGGRKPYMIVVPHDSAGINLATVIPVATVPEVNSLPQGPAGPAGPTGADGSDGPSAYAVAVANGYTGTLSQWLAQAGMQVLGNWDMTDLATPPKIWLDFDQSESCAVLPTNSVQPTGVVSKFNPELYTGNVNRVLLVPDAHKFNGRRVLRFIGGASRIEMLGAGALSQNKTKLTIAIFVCQTNETITPPTTTPTYATFTTDQAGGVSRASIGGTTGLAGACYRFGGRRNHADSFDGDNITGNMGTTPSLLWCEFDYLNGTKKAYYNGKLLINDAAYLLPAGAPTSNTPSFFVGFGGFDLVGGDNHQFDMYCGGFHDDIYSTADRQRVEGFLMWRAGLAHLLEPTHPYYSAPPNN